MTYCNWKPWRSVTGREDPFHPPKDIKIAIDGTQVLNEVPSVATAVAMFFGLIYALNLKYPKNLQYILELSPDGALWEKDVPKSS